MLLPHYFSMKKSSEQSFSIINQTSSHPLSSVLFTFFLLVLIYVPNFLALFFSPVLITTLLILTAVFHFGSLEPKTSPKDNVDSMQIQPETASEAPIIDKKTDNISCYSFVQWERQGGQLEVIYEDYEGEDDESDSPEYSQSPKYSCNKTFAHLSHSMDSDADSNESMKNVCFSQEEDEEDMIEIVLEEDNLIEIDLSSLQVNF